LTWFSRLKFAGTRPYAEVLFVRTRVYRYIAFAVVLGSLLVAAFADMTLPM